MAPVYGSDGFSDCNKLCDPEGGYSSSCESICKGFKINTSAIAEPVSILTSFGTTKSIIENITTIISADTDAKNDTINSTSNDSTITEYVNPPWIVILVITLVAAFVLAILFTLRKRLRNVCNHVFRWAKKSICKRHSQFEKEAVEVIEMNMMGSTVAEETKNLLKKENILINNGIKPEKEGKPCTCHTENSPIWIRNSRQEGNPKNAVVKPLEDAARSVNKEKGRLEQVERLTADDDTSTGREIPGSAYYDGEEFHAITHESGYVGNGDYEREIHSDISSTSTERSISGEINSETLSQTAASSPGVQVSRQNAGRNGGNRVILEIE